MGTYSFTHDELNKINSLKFTFHDLWFRLEEALVARFKELFPCDEIQKYTVLARFSRLIKGSDAINNIFRRMAMDVIGWDDAHVIESPKDQFNEFVEYAKQIVDREGSR